MKKIFLFLFFGLVLTQSKEPPKNLITIPTAGTVTKGSWDLDIYLQKNGGILSTVLIGMTSNFNLGLSYGVQNLIGNNKPAFYRTVPEVHIKYRFIEESILYPALVLGLTTQGHGDIYDTTYRDTSYINDKEIIDTSTVNRYDFKSHGFYSVLSKNWNIFGNTGLHIVGSINTWESNMNEKIPNFLIGFDKDINNTFTILAEYNFAINDKNNKYFDRRDKFPGFLNAGLRWSLTDNLQIEISLNQIRKKQKFYEMNRELKILYKQHF